MGTGGSRFGAGRPASHLKAEHCRRIDVRRWQREGILQAGRAGTWQWSDPDTGEHRAPIRHSSVGDAVMLSYLTDGAARAARGAESQCLPPRRHPATGSSARFAASAWQCCSCAPGALPAGIASASRMAVNRATCATRHGASGRRQRRGWDRTGRGRRACTRPRASGCWRSFGELRGAARQRTDIAPGGATTATRVSDSPRKTDGPRRIKAPGPPRGSRRVPAQRLALNP